MKGLLGARRRCLVADPRRQAGHQHQGVVQVGRHPLHIRGDALHAVDPEGIAHIPQQPGREQKVIGAHRQKHIQLEVSLAGGKADGRVVPHHLHGRHSDGLALGWVHLAGHDGAAGLILRDVQLSHAAPGTAGLEPDVVGDLHEVGRQGLQRPVGKHQGVLAGQCVEFVGIRGEVHPGHCPEPPAHHLVVPLGGVEAGAHGGAADGQFGQLRQGGAQHPAGGLHQLPPAGDLLGEFQGRGVLQMGPANADQVGIGLLQPPEGPCQPLRRWQHLLRDAQGRRDVESGGERVVAGLGGIHVVIGVKPHPPVRS